MTSGSNSKNGGRRVTKLVELPSESADFVMIVRLEHRLVNGMVLNEIVLGGGQPHMQGHRGPVKRLGSPYRGVSFHSCTQRWRGRIKHGSKSEHLGYFASDLEAAKAYNRAARNIHGENAQVNEGCEMVEESNEINVRTTVVETTKVPYDGVSTYTDRPAQAQKSVVTQRMNNVIVPASSAYTPMAPIKPLEEEVSCNSQFFVEDEPLVCDLDDVKIEEEPDHMRPSASEWEDFFVQYWFDENQSMFEHQDDDGLLVYSEEASQYPMKRVAPASFGNHVMDQPKRIRC